MYLQSAFRDRHIIQGIRNFSPHYGMFPLPIRSTRSFRSPKFPDQSRPTAVHDFFRTATRPYTTTHDSSKTSTRQPPRSLLNHPDPYTISTRPTTSTRPDQIDLVVQGLWGLGRIEVELIGYWSVFFCIPTKPVLYTIVKNVSRPTRPLINQYPINSRWLFVSLASGSLFECFGHVQNFRVGSRSNAKQGRPSWPLLYSCRASSTSARSLDRAWTSWSDRQWEPTIMKRKTSEVITSSI